MDEACYRFGPDMLVSSCSVARNEFVPEISVEIQKRVVDDQQVQGERGVSSNLLGPPFDDARCPYLLS